MRALLLALAIVSACEAREPSQPLAEPDPVAVVPVPAQPQAKPEPSPLEPSEPELPTGTPTRGRVVLVPLGSFPDDLLTSVEAGLVRELEVEVVRHEPIPLPPDAWYEPRKRYRAEKLLDHLDAIGEPTDKVLGLTEVDISTTNGNIADWGIFGLGNMPGRSCVVSSKRLTRKPRDREHVRFRVSTVAIHEVGHTFGLDHCGETTAECVMLDAEGGIENTDTSSGTFGPSCTAQLDRDAPLISH